MLLHRGRALSYHRWSLHKDEQLQTQAATTHGRSGMKLRRSGQENRARTGEGNSTERAADKGARRQDAKALQVAWCLQAENGQSRGNDTALHCLSRLLRALDAVSLVDCFILSSSCELSALGDKPRDTEGHSWSSW